MNGTTAPPVTLSGFSLALGSRLLVRELDFVRDYLDIERERFGERLAVSIDDRDEIAQALVPALVLQPLVENAVVHGVAPTGTHCAIAVRARRVGEELLLEVENEGVPYVPAAGRGGVGLANVRARISELYGDRARLDVRSREGDGCLATLALPWREAEPA